MKYLTMTCTGLLALLAGGCTAPTPEQYDRIARQLEDINKNLAAMTESYNTCNRLLAAEAQEALSEARAANFRKENLYKLRRIRRLPENPTPEQVRNYVEQILAASGDGPCAKDAPQVKMLRAIGPGHLDVLLPYLKDGKQVEALEYVLPELVSPKDRELVLENLKEVPALVVAAIRQGWGNDARETIFGILENGKYDDDLIPYFKTLTQNAADRERIVNLYINRGSAGALYPVIRDFPDLDIVNVNNRAWARQKKNADAAPQYAMRAAETGNVEALGYVINGFFDPKTADLFQGADVLLIKLTGLPLDRETLTTWYKTNKDKLFIDEKSGRFSIIE